MTFSKSDQNDAARVAGTYLDTKMKFFQYHKFLVLPYPRYKCIYLPEIEYSVVKKLAIEPSYHADDYKKEVIDALQMQLNRLSLTKQISMEEFKRSTTLIKKKLEIKTKNIFPELWKKIDNIEVIITQFGSDGSFDFKKINNKYRIYIWIRNTGCSLDQAVSHFIHCYVSAFVLISTNIADSLSTQWKYREAIIDFLMKNVFNEVYDDVSVTLPHIESSQRTDEIEQESEKYLKKLNLNIQPPQIKKRDDVYYINDKKIDIHSKKELALFDLLYKNKNNFVTKDTILSSLYDELEGSDWSVSKLVERLRKKIENNAITIPLIKTSRNMGYKLGCR